jgi:hypothetical protein
MGSATSESEQISHLIGDIYDAALDAGLWPSVVEGIARFVPGAFVNLFSQDATRKTAQAFYTYGISQDYLDLYFQKYIHLNPMFPTTLFFEVGRILTENDIMPKAEFNGPASSRNGCARKAWSIPWLQSSRSQRPASPGLRSGVASSTDLWTMKHCGAWA